MGRMGPRGEAETMREQPRGGGSLRSVVQSREPSTGHPYGVLVSSGHGRYYKQATPTGFGTKRFKAS